MIISIEEKTKKKERELMKSRNKRINYYFPFLSSCCQYNLQIKRYLLEPNNNLI